MELTPLQCDVLLELINIGVGRAAGMLNRIVNAHVQLQAPELQALTPEELMASPYGARKESLTSVRIEFSGNFSGMTSLIFSNEGAAKLASLVLTPQGLDVADTELRGETMREIGNIVLNGVMGSVANIMKVKLDYATPDYVEGTIREILGENGPPQGMILLARTLFSIKDHRISGEALILFSLESFDALLGAIDGICGC